MVQNAAASASGNAASGNPAAGTAGQDSDDASAPAATPPLITVVSGEVAPAGSAAGTGAAGTGTTGTGTTGTGAGTALDRLLAQGQVALSSVVLGPTNTAVFRTPQGFVVVEQGQTIPGLGGENATPVVLQNVDTDAVTLSLGDTVKSLKLEQR